MFKGKKHYRDSLHQLLQKYSDGLPLAEINRVSLMESQRLKCYKNWLEDESCYITNRLLTESEFERELAEIKLEISKLTELISLYNS
jgi:hypothetical protein